MHADEGDDSEGFESDVEEKEEGPHGKGGQQKQQKQQQRHTRADMEGDSAHAAAELMNQPVKVRVSSDVPQIC